MPRRETGYRGISLRKELVDKIEKYVKTSGKYRGISDFVAEASRLRLETVQEASA